MTSQPAATVVMLTSPSRAAVASLVVEGDSAASLVGELFYPASGRPLEEYDCGRIVFGRWQSKDTGEEIVVCRRLATRVEIHCHGGRAAAPAIIASLERCGCREISWQQWVRRSASDPIAADAQIALSDATTERTAMILWDQHAGALCRAVRAVGELIAAGDTERAVEAIDELAGWSGLGRHLVGPWKVVLAGRPNVGKSSLINALVGYQRAIVHPTPGTTRDVVTASTAVDGWPIELSDTAGLRGGGQPLESAGMELARERLGSADLVLLIFDGSGRWSGDDEDLLKDWPEAVRVVNKCDLPAAAGQGQVSGIRTSAVRGDGLDELERAVADRLVPRVPPEGQPMPFLPWHVDTLTAAREALSAGKLADAQSVLAKFEP